MVNEPTRIKYLDILKIYIYIYKQAKIDDKKRLFGVIMAPLSRLYNLTFAIYYANLADFI